MFIISFPRGNRFVVIAHFTKLTNIMPSLPVTASTQDEWRIIFKQKVTEWGVTLEMLDQSENSAADPFSLLVEMKERGGALDMTHSV